MNGQQESKTWDAGAQNAERSLSAGPTESENVSLRLVSVALHKLAVALEVQNELMQQHVQAMVVLAEQTAALVETVVSQEEEDEEDEEPRYLDGSKM